MARLIQIQPHPGLAGLARSGHHFKSTAVGALMLVLVTLGSVALRAGSSSTSTSMCGAAVAAVATSSRPLAARRAPARRHGSRMGGIS